MTTQESFKRRIRDRMAKTGERYGAARRSLIDKAEALAGRRVWISQPEHTDEVIREATGRDWNDWCDLIEAWPGHTDGHKAIADHLCVEHGLDGWWSQTVTVGYERIVGIRRPHQRLDGTYSVGKSKTMTVDADLLRSMLVDDADRSALFPGMDTELRSGPQAKALRVAVGPGVAMFTFVPKGDGRTTVTVTHESLPEPDHVEEWRAYWGEWLEVLAAG